MSKLTLMLMALGCSVVFAQYAAPRANDDGTPIPALSQPEAVEVLDTPAPVPLCTCSPACSSGSSCCATANGGCGCFPFSCP
jgi:hypothetical protein